MIITTTPQIDGRKIVEYKSLVFGEIVMGADFIKDLKAGFTNFFGGRSQAYEEEFINARMAAINEMWIWAQTQSSALRSITKRSATTAAI